MQEIREEWDDCHWKKYGVEKKNLAVCNSYNMPTLFNHAKHDTPQYLEDIWAFHIQGGGYNHKVEGGILQNSRILLSL